MGKEEEVITGEMVEKEPEQGRQTSAIEKRRDDRALVPDYDSLINIARGLAKSCMFPGIKTEWEALAVIEYGRELGFAPVISLQTIIPIEGKLGIESKNLLAKLEASGIKVTIVEYTEKRCCLRLEKKGKDPYEFEFTMEEASKIKQYSKRSQAWKPITEKHNWRNYPKEMLMWRCVARAQRAYAPGVALGLITKEEVLDGVFDEIGEQEQKGTKQLRVSPKKAEPPKPEQEPEQEPEKPKPEPKKTTAKKTKEKPAEPAAKPLKESPPPKKESPAVQLTDEERIESFREYIHDDFNIRFGPEKWRKQYQHFKMFLLDFQKEKGRKWVGVNEFQRLTFALGDPDDLQVIRDNISWTLGRWRLWEKQKEEELEVLAINGSAGAADAGE